MKQNRYIRSPDTEEFLQAILETSKNRETPIPEGAILWRAQLGHGLQPIVEEGEHINDFPGPLPPDRMKPLRHEASEGRANPKGIPYLYLSDDKDTAMAEGRPWVGLYISLAQFKVLKNLTVIDCSIYHTGFKIYFGEPDPEERERAVWQFIDRAFAKPVNRSDKKADYVPTQIIAELFKDKGFDGIAYKSALGKGLNIVLFDIDAAELINCSLYKAETVSFSFQKESGPYFIKKHYEKSNST